MTCQVYLYDQATVTAARIIAQHRIEELDAAFFAAAGGTRPLRQTLLALVRSELAQR